MSDSEQHFASAETSANTHATPARNSADAVYRMQRKLGRILAMQFLFAMDVQPDFEYSIPAFDDFVDLAKDENRLKCDDKVYRKAAQRARKIVEAYLEHREEVDEMIRNGADNWALERMNCIDRNLMRLAVCEMRYDNKVNCAIAINEAIELAKQYAQPESPKFINGVLDNVRRQIEAMPLSFGNNPAE